MEISEAEASAITYQAIQENRERMLAERRASRQAAQVYWEARDFQWRVWSKTKGRCWYCGRQCSLLTSKIDEQFHMEHQTPKSRGGPDTLENMFPSCRPCNMRKGAATLEEFRLQERHRRYPVFGIEHVRYMQQLGIQLPHDFPCYPPILFWGEQQDVQEFLEKGGE